MFQKVKPIAKYKGVVAYDCGDVMYVRLEKWAIVSDHTHSNEEIVFLMDGKVEAIIWGTIEILKSPLKITIPPNTYHKFTALTEVTGLEIK